MNKDELIKKAQELAAPVDYNKLVDLGFLEKTKTKNKYKILKELPKEVSVKVVKATQKPDGLYVTFLSSKKVESFRNKMT